MCTKGLGLDYWMGTLLHRDLYISHQIKRITILWNSTDLLKKALSDFFLIFAINDIAC